MPSQPKATIWIPAYNHASYLPAAIESALAQTYENLEIVIVDDGSTDDSLAIAQSYAARHPDVVRVFTHPGHANRGVSATVNLCFEKSTGKYVQGMASDDLLHPRKVAEQVAYLERHPELGWVYGHAFYVDENNRPRPELGLFGRDLTRTADPVEELILGNAICGITVLKRREVVSEVGPLDETLVFSDWDFWVRLAARHKMGFLPGPRVRYRVHTYNTSVGIPHEIGSGHSLAVMKKLRLHAARLGGALMRPRTQALLDLQCAFFSYTLHDEEAARKHLAAAFVTDPTLRQDPLYLCRWLSHCQHYLRQRGPPFPKTDFVPWVRAQLSGEAEEAFLRVVARYWRFGPVGQRLCRAEVRLETARTVLASMLRDRRVWRERELFAFHIAALAGQVRRGLGRLMRSIVP